MRCDEMERIRTAKPNEINEIKIQNQQVNRTDPSIGIDLG